MDKYIILGHENPDNDSIISGYLLEKIMKKHNYDVSFIIPDETISEENLILANYVGINPTTFQKPLPKDSTIKYILVDHHEREVPGEIVAIIDHHPTDKNIITKYYQNEPACSTSCLIARQNETTLSIEDIKAICLSAMVDTAAFHSNKTVESDSTWIKELCKKYNFNYSELVTISMCPTDMSNLESAAFNGLKEHNIHNHKIASSFLHLPNPEEKEKEVNKIINYLQRHTIEKDYDLFAFIVHDITNFKTTLYKISATTIDKKDYDEYTSRGSNIIPELTEELKQSPKTYKKREN